MKPKSRFHLQRPPLGLTLAITLVLSHLPQARAADGTWTTDGSSTWSATSNWAGGIIADGLNSTANFSSTDITANRTISLDSSRIISNLSFGDTNTATGGGWLLGNNSNPANILTLAASSGSPTITTLNVGPSTQINVVLAGVYGFAKEGNGTLILSGANTYSGTTTINAGTVVVLGSGRLGVGAALTLNAGQLILTGAPRTVGAVTLNGGSITGGSLVGSSYALRNGTVSAALGGVGTTLTKTGVGSVILSGANTYTGATTISGGTLAISGAGTLGSGAALTLNNGELNLGATAQTVGAVTLNGGSISNGSLTGSSYLLKSGAVSADLGGLAVNLSKTTSGSVILSGTNTYGGMTTINGGTLQFAKAGSLYNGTEASWTKESISIASGATLALSIGGGGEFTVVQSKTLLGNLTTAINNNGLQAGASFALDTTNAAGDTTFDQAIADSTGTGSGALNIAKLGSGTLILNQANTYSGTTTLSGGTLHFAKAASLYNGDAAKWTAANVSAASGTTLAINVGGIDEFTTAQAKTLLGNLTTAINNNGLQSGSTFALDTSNATGDTTFDQVIANSTGTGSGALGLTKLGSGKLILNQANTYTGPTTITAGTLALTGAGTLGTASALTLNAGQLDLGSTTQTVGAVNLNGGSITNGSLVGSTYNLASGSVSAGLGGVGVNLSKTGVGSVTLSGANTYTGTTTISGGILAISGAGTLGNGAALTLNAGQLDLGATTQTVGAVTFNAGSITNGSLVGSSYSLASGAVSAGLGGVGVNLGKTGVGTVILSGANTYTGSTTISGGILAISGVGTLGNGATLTLDAGQLDLGGTTQTVGAVTLNAGSVSNGNLVGSSYLLVSGTVSAGLGGTGANLNKTGAGVVVLSGTNTYTGTTTISAGTLQFAKTAALYNSNAASWTKENISVASGATLAINIGGINDFTAAQAKTLLDHLSTNIANNGLQAGSTFALDTTNATGDTTFDQSILASTGAGSGTMGVTKLGEGKLIFNQANTYAGPTTLNAGFLAISGAGTLGDHAALTINAGQLDLGTTTQTVGAVTLNQGSIINGGLIASSYNLASGSVSAALGGAGVNLSKTSTGTVTLSGANTYSGTTTIDAGTLAITGAGTLGTGAALTLNAGQLDLGGTTQNVGAVSLNSGSITNGSLAGTSYIVGSGSVSAALGGTGATLSKITDGTATLSGTNTYTGATTISAGTLAFEKTAALYNSNAASWTKENLSVASGGTLSVNVGGSGEFTLGQAKSLLTGLSTGISNNGLQAGSSFGISTAHATGDTTFDQAITNSTGTGSGSLGFAKSGANKLILNQANTYTGITSVTGGTLQIAKTASLYNSDSAQWTKANISVGGGTLAVNVGGTGEFSASSAGTLLGNLSGAVSNNGLQAGSSFGIDTTNATGATYFNQAIANTTGTGGGAIGFTKLGSGTLSLSGVNTYTGATTISGGTLKFGGAASLYNSDTAKWTKSNISVASGATLEINVNGVGGFTASQATMLFSNLSTGINQNGLQAGSTFAIDTTDYSFSASTLTNTTFAQVIADSTGTGGGALGFTKLGNNTLTLNQANTYSGPTTINKGTLAISGAGTLGNHSALTLNSEGNYYSAYNYYGERTSLNLGGTTQTVGAVTLNGASMDISNGNLVGTSFTDNTHGGYYGDYYATTVSAGLGGEGANYSKSGTGRTILSGTNTYTGTTSIGAGSLQFVKAAALYNSTESSWTKENISVAGGATLAVSIGGSGEFTVGQAKTLFTNLSTSINNNGLQAGSTFAISASGTSTFDQSITDSTGTGGGALGFTKLGYGTLILDHANTYTGPTNIYSGTLAISGAGTLGSNSALTLDGYRYSDSSSAHLDLGGTTQAVGAVTVSNGSIGNGNLVGPSYSLGNATISAGLGGAGVNLTSNGNAMLSGANTYTGTTSVNGGSLQFAQTSALYNSDESKWTKANISVVNGATLAVSIGGTGEFSVAQGKTLLTNLSTSINNNGLRAGSSFGIDTRNAAGDTTFDQVIADSTGTGGGALGLTKLGSGTLVLNQANTYTGPTRVYGGTLAISGAGTLGNQAALDISGGEMNLGGTTQSVGTVYLNGGSIANGNLVGTSYSLYSGTVSAGLGGAGANLSVGSYGDVTLSGTNTYTGTTTVGYDSTLHVEKTASLYAGDQSKWTKENISVNGNSSYYYQGTLAVKVGGAGEFSVAQAKTLLGNLSTGINYNGLQAGSRFGIDTTNATGDTTFDRVITDSTGNGAGSLGFTKLGTNTLVLNQANTYSGDTRILDGTLKVGLANALPSGAGKGNVISSYAGKLDINGFDVSINGLGSTDQTGYGLVVNDALGTNKKLTLGNGNADGNFSGSIADNSGTGGTLALDKVGTGTQTLNGNNSYTGATTVRGGTLVINGSVSTTSITTVSALATIAGSGSLGSLTVNAGGTVAPGNSPGILNTGDLTINGTFAAQIYGTTAGSSYDQLNVSGTVNLGGTLLLTLSNFTPEAGNLFFLINNDGIDAVTGTLSGLPQDSQFDMAGQRWAISYNADSGLNTFGGGNDVALRAMVVAAVPEPGTALLGGLSLLALLRRRRV